VPLPDRLARFNRWVTNPLARTVAGRLPSMAIVHHRGRRSGRAYRTPVNAFPAPSGFVLALTYGADRDWVRNVLAEGGCVLEYRGRLVRARAPQIIVGEEGSRLVPPFVRRVLRRLRVAEFLILTAD
jgi:deazaflavin-dependent oxidoreductase (nitroreductase family)